MIVDFANAAKVLGGINLSEIKQRTVFSETSKPTLVYDTFHGNAILVKPKDFRPGHHQLLMNGNRYTILGISEM